MFYVDPDSLFQLHALWHGAMSLAVWFMYLYFRTFGMEHPIDTSFLLLSSSSSSSKAAASSVIDSSGLELSQKGGSPMKGGPVTPREIVLTPDLAMDNIFSR